MKKMVITGVNGFIGRHAKEYFEKEYEITGLDLAANYSGERVPDDTMTYYQCNMSQESAEKAAIFTGMQPDVILLETIHVRKLLESEAAAQAAKNIRKDEIDDLEKSLITTIQEIRKLKTGQDNDFFQADAKFHRLILRASHNPVFEQCLEAMPNIMSLHQYWSLKMTTPMDEVVTYHCSIFENILIHNEAGAREAMMAHLSRVEELLARKVQEEKEGESPVPKVWYTT